MIITTINVRNNADIYYNFGHYNFDRSRIIFIFYFYEFGGLFGGFEDCLRGIGFETF